MADYKIKTYDELKKYLKDSNITTEQMKNEILPATSPEVLEQYVKEYPVGKTSSYASDILNKTSDSSSNVVDGTKTESSTGDNGKSFITFESDTASQSDDTSSWGRAFVEASSKSETQQAESDFFVSPKDQNYLDKTIVDYTDEDWINTLNRLKDKASNGEITEEVYYRMLDELKDNPNGPSDEMINESKRIYQNQFGDASRGTDYAGLSRREKEKLDKMIIDDCDAGGDNVKHHPSGFLVDSDYVDTSVVTGLEGLQNVEVPETMVPGTGFFGGFASTAASSLSSSINGIKNVMYEASDMFSAYSKIVALRNNAISLKKIINESKENIRGSLNPDTLKRIDLDSEFSGLLSAVDDWKSRLDQLLSSINKAKNRGENVDETGDGTGSQTFQTLATGAVGGTYHGSHGSTTRPIEEITPIVQPEPPLEIVGEVLGAVTFTEIVILYQEIGGDAVQSSPTASYGLIDVLKQDGKYYYKIVDQETGQILYVEINDKVKLDSEYNSIIEVKEKTMILNSTELNSQNVVKVAQESSVYLVKQTVENQDIRFANIIDTSDNMNYYIPISDSVEVISLESIGTNEG